MLELLCQDMGGKLCASVRPYLESAAKSLDLATDFISLEIRIDDLPDSKEPWLHLVRSGDPAEKRVLGTLFCSESCFCKKAPAVGTVFPTAEVWDQALAPKDGLPFDLNLFSESRTEKFLHHELLLARDLVRGLVVPRAIATGQIEADVEAQRLQRHLELLAVAIGHLELGLVRLGVGLGLVVGGLGRDGLGAFAGGGFVGEAPCLSLLIGGRHGGGHGGRGG